MKISFTGFKLAALAAILAATASAGDARVTNTELGFSFAVPAGYADFPDSKANPNVIYSYARTDNGVVFGIVRMHLILPKRGMEGAKFRPGLNVKVESTKWNGCDIDVCNSTQTTANIVMCELDAMIPLKKEAISLQVAGADKNRDAVRAEFNKILNSIQGETNWDSADGDSTGGREFGSDDERAGYKIGYKVGQVMVYGFMAIVIIWVIMRIAGKKT